MNSWSRQNVFLTTSTSSVPRHELQNAYPRQLSNSPKRRNELRKWRQNLGLTSSQFEIWLWLWFMEVSKLSSVSSTGKTKQPPRKRSKHRGKERVNSKTRNQRRRDASQDGRTSAVPVAKQESQYRRRQRRCSRVSFFERKLHWARTQRNDELLIVRGIFVPDSSCKRKNAFEIPCHLKAFLMRKWIAVYPIAEKSKHVYSSKKKKKKIKTSS